MAKGESDPHVVLYFPYNLHKEYDNIRKHAKRSRKTKLAHFCLAAFELVASLGDPVALKKKVTSLYSGRGGNLTAGARYRIPKEVAVKREYANANRHTPYEFVDIFEAEMKHHTLQELQFKWDLTREELAILLFWHVIADHLP